VYNRFFSRTGELGKDLSPLYSGPALLTRPVGRFFYRLRVASRSLTKNVGHVLQRRAAFFLYVAVTVTLAGGMVYFGWVRTWSSVYVPSMYPPFADMRVIAAMSGSVNSVASCFTEILRSRADRATDRPVPSAGILALP
jgi:hypothetical protein